MRKKKVASTGTVDDVFQIQSGKKMGKKLILRICKLNVIRKLIRE